MKRTFCTVIGGPLAEAALAPVSEAMARARHWQFRELHIHRRPQLDVRKEAQATFGLTKRRATSNKYDLDQAVNAWAGTLKYRRQQLTDRIKALLERIERLTKQIDDPKTSRSKRRQKRFTSDETFLPATLAVPISTTSQEDG